MKISLSSTQIHTGSLILVNGECAYRETEQAPLVPVWEDSPVLLRQRAANLLTKLLEALGGRDAIVPVSGWRSFAQQQEIWDSCLLENGPEYTRTFVALPGHSEHQTGLAIDLGLRQDKIDFICPELPYHGICQRFREKAPDYGFIQRYPAGKEQVTGIGHEPWHFRYVGIPHAKIMAQRGMVLEEYLSYLKQFRYNTNPCPVSMGRQKLLLSYLPAGQGGYTRLSVDSTRPYDISGNNCDGFILTEWRQ